MERIRTFFAVSPPEPVRLAAVHEARALRERAGRAVRWVPEENLHVTLQFLGNIDPVVIPTLTQHVGVELASVAPFTVRLGGLMAFPGPRRPRVIALDLGPHELLAGLAAAVGRGVVGAGLALENRRFRPHLTLGRVRDQSRNQGRNRGGKGGTPLDLTEDVTAPDTAEGDAFAVTEAVLFHSQLQGSPAPESSDRPGSSPQYTPLERIPLGDTLHP